MKKCTKCGIEKELGEYYWDKRGFYLGKCRKCTSQISMNWAKNNPEKRKIINEKGKPKAQARMAEYRIENKEKLLESDRLYRENNKEKVKQSNLNYRKNNKERVKRKDRESYQRRKEKVAVYARKRAQENPELFKERLRAYRKDNNYKVNTWTWNRRARIRNQMPDWVTNEMLYHFYKLSALMQEIMGVKYNVDHIHPISKGGEHSPFNLQVMTQRDNVQKSNKIII